LIGTADSGVEAGRGVGDGFASDVTVGACVPVAADGITVGGSVATGVAVASGVGSLDPEQAASTVAEAIKTSSAARLL
jgi:predicted polyphosphate/ATP-dependent NAD kinase